MGILKSFNKAKLLKLLGVATTLLFIFLASRTISVMWQRKTFSIGLTLLSLFLADLGIITGWIVLLSSQKECWDVTEGLIPYLNPLSSLRKEVVRQLQKLSPERYFVFCNAYLYGTRPIDFIVVGPTGIFAIFLATPDNVFPISLEAFRAAKMLSLYIERKVTILVVVGEETWTYAGLECDVVTPDELLPYILMPHDRISDPAREANDLNWVLEQLTRR